MENVSILGMFILGLATSLSPCSLVILIATISFIIEESKSIKQGLLLGLNFSFGMSLTFFIFGLFISYIGQFVRYSQIFFIVAGIVLIYFGLHQLGIVYLISYELQKIKLFKIFFKSRNLPKVSFIQKLKDKFLSFPILLSSFLLGILFSLGWAPCTTALTMPAIIYIMAKQTTVLGGGILFFTFGVGHSIPIVIISTLGTGIKEKLQAKMIKAGKIITNTVAIFMIILGVIIILLGQKISNLI